MSQENYEYTLNPNETIVLNTENKFVTRNIEISSLSGGAAKNEVTISDSIPEDGSDLWVDTSSSSTAGSILIDSVPTANSQHLITSGGVYSAINSSSTVGLTQVFHAGTSAPTNTKLLWIDTTTGIGGLKYYNGSTWVPVPVAYV